MWALESSRNSRPLGFPNQGTLQTDIYTLRSVLGMERRKNGVSRFVGPGSGRSRHRIVCVPAALSSPFDSPLMSMAAT